MLQRCFRYFTRWLCGQQEFPNSPSELVAAWQEARKIQPLGFILIQARQSKHLSLLELQTVTGIPAAYLAKLEYNLVPRPSLLVIMQLVEALDLSMEEVLDRLAPYDPEDLLSLERHWRTTLKTQPGNRNGQLVIEAIAYLWKRQIRTPAPPSP